MKYIMYEIDLSGVKSRFPIIFPDHLVHKIINQAIQYVIKKHELDAKEVSAGTIHIYEAECSGESETLKLKSDLRDSDIVTSFDYLKGIVISTESEDKL